MNNAPEGLTPERFIYCREDRRGDRWFYCETPGWRERLPNSSSDFRKEKTKAYPFATRAEAWEHCRQRRVGSHWRRSEGRWIVIRLRNRSA